MTKEISNPDLLNEAEKDVEIKPLYRGVWAEKLASGQELPVGGSLFSKELTTKLELDFESFDSQLENYTPENVRDIYEKSKEGVINWLKQVGSDFDPYLFFLCYNIQRKTQELMQFDPLDPQNPSKLAEREAIYREKKTPKLSELKGKAACGELAALAQYIMQKSSMESSYVTGITIADVEDIDEWPEPHTFLVLKNPDSPKETLIFDIARPFPQQSMPKMFKTEVPFTYESLKGQEEALIKAKEILRGAELYFGVGDAACGEHKVIR